MNVMQEEESLPVSSVMGNGHLCCHVKVCGKNLTNSNSLRKINLTELFTEGRNLYVLKYRLNGLKMVI